MSHAKALLINKFMKYFILNSIKKKKVLSDDYN